MKVEVEKSAYRVERVNFILICNFAVVAIFLSSRAVGLAPYPVSTGQLDSRQAVGDNFA